MKCIICRDNMDYYFSKQFDSYNLKTVDYFKCRDCGFVASKTHFDMRDTDWQELNVSYHEHNNNRQDNPYNRNQRYFYQAQMLHLMSQVGIIAEGAYLDWGSGRGDLSDRLKNLFNIKMNNFDKYIEPNLHSLAESELVKRNYNLVTNTGVFEHVKSRETLDEIESYVMPDGCLAVHTLVRGAIPQDPNWMYLLPVHCAFHTNSSMQRLMLEWGYTCSTYNELAKMWCMFRSAPDKVQEKVSLLNRKLGWEFLHFKSGFMDFWQ